MGVTTTADEAKDNAKEHIEKAYKSLLVAIDSETWGSSDFSEKYINTMEDVIMKLITIKRDL